MSHRPSNFPGHRANSDFTDSQTFGHGHDPNRGRENPAAHRRQQDAQNGYQAPQLHSTGSLGNLRESFMVPHTGRVFAEHQNMSPYDWPSMNRHDTGPPEPEPNQQPGPNQPASQGPKLPPLRHTGSLCGLFDPQKDRRPELKRNVSARDKLLARQRKPSSAQRGEHLGFENDPVRREHNVSQERLGPGGNPGTSQMTSPPNRLFGREKKGPPVAYNRNAANVESAAARGLAPYFNSSGNLRESRNAAGVDTFIQSLKDKPLPDKGASHHDYEREQNMVSHPSGTSWTSGRKVSFDTPNEDELRHIKSRKGSFHDERLRNNDRGNLNTSYTLFPPQTDVYGNQHRTGESALYRSPEDDRFAQSQVSPPMRPPNRNASFESPNPEYRPRPDSYQMFDPHYHRNNDPSHRQRDRHNQGLAPVQSQSNFMSSINNGTIPRNKSIHFSRAPGSMAKGPTAALRATVYYSELQSWTCETRSLYQDVKLICCQCNGHSELYNEDHKQGLDLAPFTCPGSQGHNCYHIPCSDCYFHSRKLKRMAAWPTRRTLNENTLVFGSVKWTWLCHRCGAAKRTDHPSGSHPLSWEKKWECNGCGQGWNHSCPTFLIEGRDLDELNRAAEHLLRVPHVSRFSPETKKEKRDLGQRVDRVVHKAGKEFKKLLHGKTEVREIIRPSTSRSHRKVHRFGNVGERLGHFGDRERSLGKVLRRVKTVDNEAQESPRRLEPERSSGKLASKGERRRRHERREPIRRRSSPQLETMGDVERNRDSDKERSAGTVKINVPRPTAYKRKNSMSRRSWGH